MIPLLVVIICTTTLYAHAKKIGQSSVKWALIGMILTIAPLILIPNIIIRITERPDLDGPSLMFAVIVAIILNAIIKKRMQPPKSAEPSL